jgi:hypothetical protein
VVAELYGAAHYGAISGLMSFWITLARAAGPTVVALMYTAAGGYGPAWAALAVVAVAATGAYLAGEHAHANEQTRLAGA